MKNKPPRRHHYVPQWYQAGFADGAGLLWVYDRQTQRYYQNTPKNICCERDLYTIDPAGRRDQRIETEFMGQVDGDGAVAVRMLARGLRLDQDWTESFSIFLAFLITRTPAFRAMMSEMYKATAEEVMRLMTSDLERAAYHLEQYRKLTGDSTEGVTPESLVSAVKGGHLKVNVTERPFLQHMLEQVDFLMRLLASFEMELLIAPAGSGFIISDYPFVVVPPGTEPTLAGLGIRGALKYFPLNRWLCLKMGDQGVAFLPHTQIGKEDVRIINQNVAVNSERFIIGPVEKQLKHVIARSNTEMPDPNPRNTVNIVQSDPGGSLFQATFWPVRKFFHLKR